MIKNKDKENKGDKLTERLLDFSVQIIKLVNSLPKTDVGKHIGRSEEHTSELQSHSFISYAVFCLKKKKIKYINTKNENEAFSRSEDLASQHY